LNGANMVPRNGLCWMGMIVVVAWIVMYMY
jgi:hypothetical protein